MAIKDFANEINYLLSTIIDDQKGGFVTDGGVTILEINASSMPKALRESTNDILEGIARKQTKGSNTSRAPVMNYKKFNKIKVWRDMISQVSSELKAQNTKYDFTGYGTLKAKNEARYTADLTGGIVWKQGIYIEELSPRKIVLQIVTAQTKGFSQATATSASEDKIVIEKIFDQMIEEIWDKWIDYIEKRTPGKKLEGYKPGQGGIAPTYDLGRGDDEGFRYSASAKSVNKSARSFTRLVGAKVKRSHKNETTTGAYALEELENYTLDTNIKGNTIQTIDLRRAVLSDVRIKARNTRLKNRTKLGGVSGLPGQNRVYEISLSKNTRESTDLQKVLNKGRGGAWKGTLVKVITDFVTDQIKLGNISKADAPGSKPFTEDVQDSAILAIADAFLPKNGKVLKVTKKISSTPTKPSDDRISKQAKPKGRLSSKKRISLTSKGIGNLGVAASAARRTQSGKRTDKELSINKLKYLINRSLGPAIRKNMGRPALQNQTGRFSNSAELVKLRQSKRTLVGEYTYQKNPYMTFENLGTKQWPQGYNPKPLISKSIRDVAQRHVEAKFTLRRI